MKILNKYIFVFKKSHLILIALKGNKYYALNSSKSA